MTGQPCVPSICCERQFRVSCETTSEDRFSVGTRSISVRVSQRIRRGGSEQIWESVGVYAEEEKDGTLVVRILVFNPEWDGPLQIATIQSRPSDAECLTPLGCNLDHVAQ